MYLIQILLPLVDDKETSSKLFSEIRSELTSRFGGLTLYRNAPAEGLWDDGADLDRDAIVVAEVMAGRLDLKWWAGYRKEPKGRFRQDEIVIRALAVARL